MTYPGLSHGVPLAFNDGVAIDVELSIRSITECRDSYEIAKEYDDINLWEYASNSREGRTLRQAGIEYDPNFCGVVIDSVSNRMEILSVTATMGETGDEEASESVTKILNEVWEENELDNYYREWNRNALRDGDGYLIVWPDADFEDPESPYVVNITYVDPRMGRMFYDEENPRKKKFFAQMWEIPDATSRYTLTRLNLFYPDRIEKYISKDRSAKRAQDFIPYEDEFDGGWPLINPYGKIPAFHLRTSHQYGKPEHRNAFSLQDAISKLLEMMMVSVEFLGYPQRYAIQEADSYGTQGQEEDPLSSIGPDDSDEFSELQLNQLPRNDVSNETGSEFEANPGGLQLFKNFKEVGTWKTSDPANYLEPWREMARAISSTTDTPLYKFQGFGGTPPSGESLRISEAPLNKKVKDRTRLFGSTWSKALEFALELLGISAKVVVTWEAPETTDMMDVWNLARAKIELGVPMEVALMQAGVPEHQAAEWAELKRQKDEAALAAAQSAPSAGGEGDPKALTGKKMEGVGTDRHLGAAVIPELFDAVTSYAKQRGVDRSEVLREALSNLTGVVDTRSHGKKK